MEQFPSALEAVMQRALDILRKIAQESGEQDGDFRVISVKPTRVLTQNGLSHTDAERAYAGLKRNNLVIVIKRGRSSIEPILKIDMSTSVVERRLQRIATHKRGHTVSTNQALLDYYTCLEHDLRKELDKVLQAKAEVQARMAQPLAIEKLSRQNN